MEVDGRLTVMTAHSFNVGRESFRFLVAGLGPGGDADARRVLRTVGVALSLTDEVGGFVEQVRLGGRLHG